MLPVFEYIFVNILFIDNTLVNTFNQLLSLGHLFLSSRVSHQEMCFQEVVLADDDHRLARLPDPVNQTSFPPDHFLHFCLQDPVTNSHHRDDLAAGHLGRVRGGGGEGGGWRCRCSRGGGVVGNILGSIVGTRLRCSGPDWAEGQRGHVW